MARLRESAEISYAVRLPVVFKYLGTLCFVCAIVASVPGVFAAVCAEFMAAAAYAAAVVVFVAIGAFNWRNQAPRHIQRNEAFVVAALIFLLTALVMAGPLAASGLSFENALFESVSGITTTGLSALPSVAEMPRSFLFGRAWLQWFGGLGIVVLGLALAPHAGARTRQLGLTEADHEDLIGSTRAHARRVLFVYSSLTVIAWAAIWAWGVSPFDAATHALAAVSTGGFSSHDESLAAFPSFWPRLAVILTCLLGSVSLPFYWRVGREGWRALLRELQLPALLALATAASLLLAAFMMRTSASSLSTAGDAGLMALSAQTTAGFSTVSVAELDPAAKLVLIFSMAIGGGTGSTAGGFKVLRLLIVARVLQSLLLRTALPKHAVHQPHLGGRRLDDAVVQSALLVVTLFGGVVLVSWLPFLAWGYDPLNALFEVVSATGTVGLSTGISSEPLPALLKAVLCLDMLLGRLEFVALLVLLFPRTWIGKRVATS